MSVDIGGLRLASSRLQAREVNTDTSGLEIIGAAITGVGEIKQNMEKRDAKAWSIKADSDLRFAGLEALEQAKNEAETPDKIGELFFQKLEQRKSEIGESAPNQFAIDEYNNIYENVRRGLGQNAIQTELEQTSELRRRQIDDSIQKGINFVRNGGSYSDTQALMQKYYEQADGVLDPVELDSYKRDANKQLKQSFLEYRFEKGDIAGVQKLINDDKFAQDFTGKEIGAYRDAIKKQKAENDSKQRLIDFAFSGKGFIDPKDKQAQKATDLVFQQSFAEGFYNAEPEAYNATVGLTVNTGIVPDNVKGFIRSSWVNPSPETKILAYQYISDVQDSNPNALGFAGIKQEAIDEAEYYISLKNSGVPEQDAYNIVRQNFNPKDKTITDIRKKELEDTGLTGKGLELDSIDLSDMFDPSIFVFEPDVIDVPTKELAYKAKYKSLYDEYYKLSGDTEYATKRAEAVFKKSHGVSKVTNEDGYVTDYPPENYYKHPIFEDPYEGDLTSKWMRDQLTSDVKAELNRKVDADSLRLVADQITDREIAKGVSPSYSIFEVTEDNGLQYISRIRFDLNKAIEERRKYLKEERKKPDVGLINFLEGRVGGR